EHEVGADRTAVGHRDVLHLRGVETSAGLERVRAGEVAEDPVETVVLALVGGGVTGDTHVGGVVQARHPGAPDRLVLQRGPDGADDIPALTDRVAGAVPDEDVVDLPEPGPEGVV